MRPQLPGAKGLLTAVSGSNISTVLIVVPEALLSLNGPSQTTATLVVVLAVLVSHLTTRLSSAVLSPFLEAWVQIGTDDTFIQFRPANVLHAVESVLVCVVLDEAETTGRLAEAVETHDEALHFAALGEELVHLLLGGVEGQIADIESGGIS